MDVLMWVLSAVYAAALVYLLRVGLANRSRYALGKAVCSGLFVLGAVVVYFTGRHGATGRFLALLVALLLCAAGDVLLGLANKTEGEVQLRPFMMGAGSFSLAHIAFFAFFAMRSATGWDIALLIAVFLLVLLHLMESRQAIDLGKHQMLGYVYTFLVGMMAGMELITAYFDGFANLGDQLLAVGVALFFISDFILLYLYYGVKTRSFYRPANLISYYAGIWLIALSAHWI